MPPGSFKPPVNIPGRPLTPTPPAAPGPMEKGLSEAENSQQLLEQKISDLEKKLMEEREKVLLASLRSKEEEAVSAKVETSIKEIQDKLRREKKEQELEESRRKAETRLLEMERRLAEEREAWVQTLKGQLGQRDQITQEMESHFSARLKDLEYRWAQEKTALEAALKDREADVLRVRQEMTLKGEQEKAFWEDRLRSVAGERDKFDRELERLKDKFQQEKEQLQTERQSLRDMVNRLESTLKLVEEKNRVEKSALTQQLQEQSRETVDKRSALDTARNQLAHEQALKIQVHAEKEAREREIATMTNQLQNQSREVVEKGAQIEALKAQISTVQGQLNHYQSRVLESNQISDDVRHQITKYRQQIETLQTELNRARLEAGNEAARIQQEADSRLRTLQTRLDWYDANANREYEMAREKARAETEELKIKLKDANLHVANLTHLETERKELVAQRESARSELEAAKSDSRRWEEEAKRLQKQADELKETAAAHENDEFLLKQRNLEMTNLIEAHSVLKKSYENAQSKLTVLLQQVDQQDEILRGKGLESVNELREKIEEMTRELEQARHTIRKLKDGSQDVEKAEELFREKERLLKVALDDKDNIVAEFKSRVQALDRALRESHEEMKELRDSQAKQAERTGAQVTAELREKFEVEKAKILKAQEEQLIQARFEAAQEAVEKARAEMPTIGGNIQAAEESIRQEAEKQMMERLREEQEKFDTTLRETKEETKKEIDRIKWESESAKEELKKAREARAQIEKEAQQLLQEAEDHYRAELEKQVGRMKEKGHGLFSSIGRLLDTPIIDFGRKKDGENE